MMGGAKTMYIGNLIKNQFLSARNWPLGAVLSIMLIVITLILMRLYTRVGSHAAVHAGRKPGRHGVSKVNSAEGGREGTLGCNELCEGRKELAQLISKRGRSR